MKKHIPEILLYGSAAFQAVQFAIAGYVYFGLAGIVTGLFGGALVNTCISVAASRVSTVAKARRGLAYAGLSALLLISPAMVAPGAFLLASRAIPDGLALLVAVLWAAAPDIAILTAGAISGKSLVQTEPPAAPRPAAVRTKSARKSVAGYPRSCAHCDAIIASPNAFGGHMKKHHPEKCNHKVYAMPISQ